MPLKCKKPEIHHFFGPFKNATLLLKIDTIYKLTIDFFRSKYVVKSQRITSQIYQNKALQR